MDALWMDRRAISTRVFAVVVLFALVTHVPVHAQLRFSGYAAELPAYQRINSLLATLLGTKQDQASNLLRVRLRPAVSLWDGAKISLEHELDAFYQSGNSSVFSGSTPGRRQAFDLRWDFVTEDHLLLSHFVDRLYFRQDFSSASLVIGRQRIAWGTGRIWNPTDLFNPINPANFSKVEKDGADAVSFKYYAGNFTDIELVINPEEQFRQWNFGARLRTNIHEFDISFLGGSFEKEFVFGGDFAGNFFDAGVRGEALYSENPSGNRFVRFILGADYQLSSLLYALLEYQYNGEGTTDVSNYNITALVAGRTLNLGKDYLFANMVYQVHALVSVSVGANFNLNDGSGFFSPLVSYSVSSDISLSVGGLLAYGETRTEYWYYPLSLYARTEWFF